MSENGTLRSLVDAGVLIVFSTGDVGELASMWFEILESLQLSYFSSFFEKNGKKLENKKEKLKSAETSKNDKTNGVKSAGARRAPRKVVQYAFCQAARQVCDPTAPRKKL